MASEAFATAKPEAAVGYFIDTSYTIRRSAKITKDNGAGPLSGYAWQAMKVSEVKGKPDWRLLTSPSGKTAYIHKDAFVPVDVAPNYRIRRLTPESTEKIGTTAKKNENLLFTGQMKTTKDKKGQESKWLEVWSKGEVGWVAAEASKLASEKAEARVAQESKPETKSVESKPAPAKPAEVPKEKPVAKPVEAKPMTKPEAKAETPKPVAKPSGRECVNTDQQFQSNDRLKKAFGGPTPFANWSGTYGIQIRPIGNTWEVTIPDWVITAESLDPNLRKSNVALKICVDATNKPFINVFGKDWHFDDSEANNITINHPASPKPIKFQKAAR